MQGACGQEVQGKQQGRQAGHLQGVQKHAEQPMMDAGVLSVEDILAEDHLPQDPGRVPENVIEVLASEDVLSSTSIQNRFDKCTDVLVTPGGRLSRSQAKSVSQVGVLEMLDLKTHFALFRNFCKLLTVSKRFLSFIISSCR